MRSRILLVGRDTLRRSKSRLHFVLITHRPVGAEPRGGAVGLRPLPGRSTLHLGGTGAVFRAEGNEGDWLCEVGPGTIHLRRAQAASAQQTGEAVSRPGSPRAFRLPLVASVRRGLMVDYEERKLISMREMAAVTGRAPRGRKGPKGKKAERKGRGWKSAKNRTTNRAAAFRHKRHGALQDLRPPG